MNDLVSTIIVTYNAESTVVETLESIKTQTYQNIELIVTDDCSNDNTVSICKEWLNTNADRFIKTELITNTENQGICANCNRGHAAAKGVWVKIIAGDDKLMPNCISDFMTFVEENPDASFVSSYMREYDEVFEESYLLQHNVGPTNLSIFDASIDEQLKQMAWSSFVWAPTMFYKLSLFKEVGGFDTKYLYEDHPFLVTILELKNRIYFMDKETVCYRFHNSSSHTSKKLFNYNMTLNTQPFVRERCMKYYSKRRRFAIKGMWALECTLHTLHLDRSNAISLFLYRKTMGLFYRIGRK
ncbi:MAG: glycosyltransferase [Paludibacter sp.]|nr:glycosyltransferase [Paludibacter sp.]